MTDFRSNKQFGNHRPRKSSGGFGGRDSGPREMFDAVCVNCGKNCKVPFKPASGKPIYCSDCFESVEKDRDNGDFSRAPSRNNYDRPSFDRPRFDKPRFEKRERPAADPAQNLKLEALSQQVNEINDKIDLILHTLAHQAE